MQAALEAFGALRCRAIHFEEHIWSHPDSGRVRIGLAAVPASNHARVRTAGVAIRL